MSGTLNWKTFSRKQLLRYHSSARNVVACLTAVIPQQWSPHLFEVTSTEYLTQLLHLWFSFSTQTWMLIYFLYFTPCLLGCFRRLPFFSISVAHFLIPSWPLESFLRSIGLEHYKDNLLTYCSWLCSNIRLPGFLLKPHKGPSPLFCSVFVSCPDFRAFRCYQSKYNALFSICYLPFYCKVAIGTDQLKNLFLFVRAILV